MQTHHYIIIFFFTPSLLATSSLLSVSVSLFLFWKRTRKLCGSIPKQVVLEGLPSLQSAVLGPWSMAAWRSGLISAGCRCHGRWAFHLDLGETKLFSWESGSNWPIISITSCLCIFYFLKLHRITFFDWTWVLSSGIGVMGILEGWTISPKYCRKVVTIYSFCEYHILMPIYK